MLVVEVHYNYHQVLALPWMTPFLPTPYLYAPTPSCPYARLNRILTFISWYIKMKNMLKKIRKKSERGQAIILIAFAIVGLVAIVGLMTDGGMTLIEYARLKRGIDSASIAAASQFRKGFDPMLLKPPVSIKCKKPGDVII